MANQILAAGTYSFEHISGEHIFTIERNTECTLLITLVGDAQITVHCTQPGASVDVRIKHIQKDTSTIKLNTVQLHTVAHTRSSVTVKGVLYDHARFDYAGMIRVEPAARHTVAEQKSHTLVLSDTAFAQATPSLEVLTNDVACKHGSAIATLDEIDIAYLTARGISPQQAEQILVDSFLSFLRG